jgi:hypothetical protein
MSQEPANTRPAPPTEELLGAVGREPDAYHEAKDK